MIKIYYNRYMNMVNSGDFTISEVIELAELEVPVRWKDAVVALLRAEV